MDPHIRKGIKRRSDWIRRNPDGARKYIRLTVRDRNRVDELFLAQRKLGSGEVSNLVDRLWDDVLARRRTTGLRTKAYRNMVDKLHDRPSGKYREATVARNVKKMTRDQLSFAAEASVDDLIDRARIQEEGNPFFYH